MRRLIVTAIILLGSIGLSSQTIKEVTDALVAKKEMKYGELSFYAVKVSTGDIVVSKNKHERMIPASTMKLLTAYAALDLLGENHVFKTIIGTTGTIDAEGVLNGDIIIRGGGDPVLASTSFSDHYEPQMSVVDQIVMSIIASGIKRVNGKIIGDGSIYDDEVYPTDWVTEDIGNYYGAGSHGLSYQENYYKIYLNSTNTLGKTVTIDESTALLPYLNYQVKAKGSKVSSDQVYVYSPAYSDYAILRGEMPMGKSQYAVKAAITDPAYELARLVRVKCNEKEIEVTNGITTSRELSLKHKERINYDTFKSIKEISSPALMDIVNFMNLKSSNLIAEHLVKQISVLKGNGLGTTKNGIKTIKAWLQKKGVGTAGISVKDGSGLSHTNLLNTNWFVTLLVKMSVEPWFDSLLNGLPESGKTGSMRRVGKGSALEGNMRAKTGYINGARAYSGYLKNAKSELIAFSIIANGYDFSASTMRKEMEKLLIKLY